MKLKLMISWSIIILLSVIVIGFSVIIALSFPSEKYSPVMSLVDSTASILAVIWFTSTLIYQSRQLSEQRKQFSLSFDQTIRNVQRESLVVANSILKEAEYNALSQNTSLNTLTDLLPLYIDFKDWNILLDSSNADEIVKVGKVWLKHEGPAMVIIRGIQTAFKVYTNSTYNSAFDFTKEADEFIYIYGSQIWTLPYFHRYQGIVQLLTEFMVSLTPGRKAAALAYTISLGLSTSEFILDKENIREKIELLRRNNYPIPEIAKSFM